MKKYIKVAFVILQIGWIAMIPLVIYGAHNSALCVICCSLVICCSFFGSMTFSMYMSDKSFWMSIRQLEILKKGYGKATRDLEEQKEILIKELIRIRS